MTVKLECELMPLYVFLYIDKNEKKTEIISDDISVIMLYLIKNKEEIINCKKYFKIKDYIIIRVGKDKYNIYSEKLTLGDYNDNIKIYLLLNRNYVGFNKPTPADSNNDKIYALKTIRRLSPSDMGNVLFDLSIRQDKNIYTIFDLHLEIEYGNYKH